jgi:hypothetical protein
MKRSNLVQEWANAASLYVSLDLLGAIALAAVLILVPFGILEYFFGG